MKTKLLLTVALLALLSGCSGDTWGWYVVDPTTENGLLNLKFPVGWNVANDSVEYLRNRYIHSGGLACRLAGLV